MAANPSSKSSKTGKKPPAAKTTTRAPAKPRRQAKPAVGKTSKPAASKSLTPAVKPRRARAKSAPKTTANTSPAPKATPKRKKTRTHFDYDVAFSFAGENRKIVENVNAQLQRSHITTFYDFDHQVKLVGENLFDLLSDIYENKARFCAIFISKHYVEKNWTRLERHAAQARAFADPDVYILPFRLDDTPVPGILNTIGYVSVQGRSARDIARIIRLKVQEARKADEQKQKGRASSKTSPKGVGATSSTALARSAASAKASAKSPSKSAPLVTAPGAFTHQGKVSASGTWLLLDGEFYRAPSVRSEAGLLVAEISPRNADEEARLESLDSRRNHYGGHKPISYAHGNKAFSVSVEGVESRSMGGKTTCIVKLRPSTTASGQSGFGSWADEEAEKQARLLLLDERTSGGHTCYHLGSGYGPTPKAGVFPPLWKRLQKRRMTSLDVLRCARLEALYHLLASGTVEHVSQLVLGPATKGVLSVSFEGRCPKRFSGQEPASIRFTSKCKLAG